MKFFAPGSKVGDDFLFERSPDQLVQFAKTGIHPNPLHVPRGEGEMADAKLVDYYSAACPHCKSLDPVWADTEKKWESDIATREDAPLVSFEKRECYDDHWKPGKDYEECKQLGITSFPNIKLLAPAEDGHGFVAQTDYSGARTAEGIIGFLKQEADMEEVAKLDQAAQHHDDKAAASLQGGDGASEPHHVAPPVPEEETRNEPTLAAPVVGKAKIEVAPAAKIEVAPAEAVASEAKADAEKATFAAVPDAIKTAMMPLPLVSLSCLPVRRSPVNRSECSPPVRAPATPTQFL